MKRAVVVGVMVAFVAIVSACKRREHSCAIDPAAGCVCKTKPFALEPSQKPVAECSPARDVTWTCCIDLDSKGETGECWCQRPICADDGKTCRCMYAHAVAEGATVKPECTADAGKICCEGQGPGSSCECAARTSCPPSSKQVDKCTSASANAGRCGHRATSCDAVKWRPKS